MVWLGILGERNELERVLAAFRADYQPPVAQKYLIRSVKSLGAEGYRIRKTGGAWEVESSTTTGLAWGLRATVDGQAESSQPALPYRCVLLDVARRYHSPSTLRSLVRAASIARLRSIQLHLTDDQNWMFPTNVMAGVAGRNRHKKPTYTVQELKDLQQFAYDRGVEIIPEIDLPGHSSLLVANDPTTFAMKTSTSRSCIDFSSPQVVQKVRILLREVISVFDKAEHIHLGGDEAYYPGLEKSVASVESTFLDFLGAMASEVEAGGKIPVVWEGFHRSSGSLGFRAKHPKLLVVAWEGTYYRPDALVSDGFKIINAGWDPFYIVGHYPDDNYTMVSPSQFARFDPYRFGHVVPFAGEQRSLALPQNGSIVGSMVCWWEGHEWDALRFLPERIIAYGERAWNPTKVPSQERIRNQRQRWWNSCFSFNPMPGFETQVELESHPKLVARPGTKLRINGDLLLEWSPTQSGRWKVQVSKGEGAQMGEDFWVTVVNAPSSPSLTTGCKVSVDGLPSPEFPPSRLTDGVTGDRMRYWLAYPCPQTAVIDLGKMKELRELRLIAFWDGSASSRYQILLSTDRVTWTEAVDASKNTVAAAPDGYRHTLAPTKARYIKLVVLGGTKFPPTTSRIVELQAF